MNRNVRIAIAGLTLSAAALVARFHAEGYTDNVIIPTKGDRPTIGFGTTEGVEIGDRTSPVKAAQRALDDFAKYEGAVKQCIKVPLHQAEYDTYAALAYNVGPTNFCFNLDKNRKIIGPSTLVQRVNNLDYVGGCNAILLYKKAAGYDCSTPGNKRCYGVWIDRLAAHKKCMAAQ